MVSFGLEKEEITVCCHGWPKMGRGPYRDSCSINSALSASASKELGGQEAGVYSEAVRSGRQNLSRDFFRETEGAGHPAPQKFISHGL